MPIGLVVADGENRFENGANGDGPTHAGSFGPNKLDNSFGPEVKFVKAPAEGQSNLPPSDGLQFFGQVDIDGE